MHLLCEGTALRRGDLARILRRGSPYVNLKHFSASPTTIICPVWCWTQPQSLARSWWPQNAWFPVWKAKHCMSLISSVIV